MNDGLRVAGFALAAALLAMTVRTTRKEAGAAVALAAGLMLFFAAITQLTTVAQALRTLSERAGLGDGTLKLLMKMLGIAYVTEFAVQACKDVGEEGIAAKASLCGKLMLVGLTLPMLLEIADLVLGILP